MTTSSDTADSKILKEQLDRSADLHSLAKLCALANQKTFEALASKRCESEHTLSQSRGSIGVKSQSHRAGKYILNFALISP